MHVFCCHCYPNTQNNGTWQTFSKYHVTEEETVQKGDLTCQRSGQLVPAPGPESKPPNHAQEMLVGLCEEGVLQPFYFYMPYHFASLTSLRRETYILLSLQATA